MKLTVIGAGNMGGAMIKGFLKSGKVDEIMVTAKSQATLDKWQNDYPELKVSLSNADAVKDADVIVLAVKPWLVAKVVDEIKGCIDWNKQVVVSVAANINCHDLNELFGPCSEGRVFYAMPNIAAEFGESMTFVTAENAAPEVVNEIENLLSLLGKTKVVEDRLMAPGMMMAGCGIAYAMRFVRAMMEGGVEMGFYPKDAQMIAQQTMKGAVTLLEETNMHPEAAIDKVTTPGGITIKGLNELDHTGFNSSVIKCLKAGL